METSCVYRLYRHCSREDTMLRLGVRNSVFLTPRHRYLSQGCITIAVPLFSHPIQLHPVFEPTKCSSTTDSVTEIITHVLIVYREAEPLHDLVFMNLKSIRQLEVAIRLQNVLSHANRVMLPFW